MGRLNIIYDELDFKSGSLYSITDNPAEFSKNIDWLEKGEWLAAGKRAGAEKIFFVENNPVVVFAECGAGLEEKVKAFNRAWCLARPRLLFLASPGEITVFDLAEKPVDENKPEEWKNLKNLDILHDLRKAAQELQAYHRDQVESGRLFADSRFGELKNRADKSLIRDLKTVRRELILAGLSGECVRFAHALIGRSIFIRYLEDRGILTPEYFKNIAEQNSGWGDLLHNPASRKGLDFSQHKTCYPRILSDKDFTYALFKNLSRDFNGDMFPGIDEEEQAVTQKHLTLIQDLLYGDVGAQIKLFFYSYNFDIVPLDLISSIYEEFYHISTDSDEKSNKKRQDGVYYTPPVLVEFVLSRILTPDVLDNSPRVLDPACGSGIFLVEAFRRFVRHEWYKNKKAPTFDVLKRILKEQIAGIEVNEEAARVTAFSLYLSMLHYLDPPAIDGHIKMGKTLPNLVASDEQSPNHFHCILPKDAFDPEIIESNPLWKERFGKECADIIVGNPPWGAPGNKADAKTKARHEKLVAWCKSNDKPIGDGEPSQAFLWRALDFLKKKGKAGMLVSAGVLFKHNTTSQSFRNKWLDCVRLEEVFNFAHVRKFFFQGAISPFIAIAFKKEKQSDSPVHYWSAKQSKVVKKVQSILLSKNDLHILRSEDPKDSTTWKTFWFGRDADRELLNFLRRKKPLIEFLDRGKCGRGYEIVSNGKNPGILKSLNSLLSDSFSRYNSLKFKGPPQNIHRFGNKNIYDGNRLIVQKGIKEKTDNISQKGSIIARYEERPYCFRHAFYGIKLKSPEEWKYKVILGILWSSTARYYFFMTTSKWGLWYHEIYFKEELLQLPIVIDKSNPSTKKIISIVDKLRGYNPQKRDIFNLDGIPEENIEKQRRKWEVVLDEAVFELYGLNDEQIDLIRDFCEVTLPFYYRPFDSIGAVKAVEKNDFSRVENYVNTFSRRWNTYLADDEEMHAEVHIGAHGNMVAVEFFPAEKNASWELKLNDDSWSYVLEQVGEALPQSMGTSQILLDGLVHVVSNSGIIIIKRNEKRFWTRSLAREDADATICKRMVDTMPKEGRDI